MIDLGIQPQTYQGEEKTPRNEMMLTYEFLDEFLPDDEGEPDETNPRWLSESIALHSLDSEKAKSTKRYYALDPNEEEEGDFPALIERPCVVTVVQNKVKDKIYNNIAGISAMRPKEAQKAVKLVKPPKVFLMDDPDVTIFKSLPDWVQDKIRTGLEYAGSPLEVALRGTGGGDSQKAKKPASKAPEASEDTEEKDGIDW